MEFIRDLQHIRRGDAAAAGGKGASLGEMFGAGMPVPPGFVVLTVAFERFLDDAGLASEIAARLERLDGDDIASIAYASDAIRRMITSAPIPGIVAADILAALSSLGEETVAVRSSATAEDSSAASWAGELESFLNIATKDILESVKKCWASLFTSRAIAYRIEKGMRGARISVAAVVQKMVQSEVAGLAFTVHPVSQDYGKMVIEACWGLGELLVGGAVTPDAYIITKDDCALLETRIAEQETMLVRGAVGNNVVAVPAEKKNRQKISDDQIRLLARLCLDVERHYGFPCDIEWVMEGGKFFVLQSRPITTLHVAVRQLAHYGKN